MHISLVAAMDKNGVIGVNGRLPWHLPDETKHFRAVTIGKPHIMGRKTLESIGRPLPKRPNIILTRDPNYRFDGCIITHTVAEALAAAGDVAEVTIGGGTDIFALFLPIATRLYLTFVEAEVAGDTFFPPWSRDEWVEVSRDYHPADDRHAYAFTMLLFERKRIDE
ncbi:MAG: dihydrofolate reductase [Chloroflexota bacterium]